MRRRLPLLIASVVLVLACAASWAAVAWVDAEVDRRVTALETERVRAEAARRRPAPRWEPESIEEYAARVERAKQRLALRGITDPDPDQVGWELRMMGLQDMRERPLLAPPR